VNVPYKLDGMTESAKARPSIPPIAGQRCASWLALGLLAAACDPSAPPAADAAGAAHRQTAFRVRADFGAPLNADDGWAAAANGIATVATEEPFRLRFELERVGDVTAPRPFRLQYRRNGGEWSNVQVADFPYAEVEERTPRVSVISTETYANGARTSDLLTGSQAPYAGGAGVALAPLTPSAPVANGQSEWEWPLVIRRYADDAVTNETGDRFEFRMTDADGRPVESDGYATVVVTVPPRLVAGTFVETPGRIGPWQAANGDLYFIMEPAESFNVLMVVKSTDGGATWREVDGDNRPATDDLEGFASALSSDTIHMLHQISEAVFYHSFRTSDHPTAPDTWAVRDEGVAATPAEPPVQAASIAVRSDGSVVAIYAGPDKIHARIRSPAGAWRGETVIDADLPPNLSGPQLVLGAGDTVHLAYTGNDGTAWYRRILPDGSLTPRELLATGLGTSEADIGSILPLVFIAETDTVVVIYRAPSGELWERRIVAHGAPAEPVRVTGRRVVQNAVDSDQAGADAIAHGTTVHVLFIEEGSGSVFHTHTGPEGGWTPATLEIDGIRAQWIRGAPLTLGGTERYGYVYDAGSDGGSGANWFADLPLDAR
jgi:hypothetical protein